jgi:FkbH-like protein
MLSEPTTLPDAKPPAHAEAVRLVIWDLDETFWHGTLTEGGMSWRPEAEQAVTTLARRGIISSICSKNDTAQVEAILARRGIRDYFVFSSISWDPKGPRLARLIEAVQLRPESVLFIDDNPMNRAEAQHFVPGLQISDETIVPRLLADPRLRGKNDPDMTRLAQYQLLDRRAVDQQAAGTDTEVFLRESGITVTIEHDLQPHLDRAIELINRTNQLNYTKKRLSEDPAQARAELSTLLAEHTIQAGLLRVQDRYGDYGFCGIYIMRSKRNLGRMLLHFAFSCRILGMGIESWLYQRLERPSLRVVGRVLTDVLADNRTIDWVRVAIGGSATIADQTTPKIAYVLARGGCDMRAISHYFRMVAGRVVEEFDTVRHGLMPMVCHSAIAAQAISTQRNDMPGASGLPRDFVRDCVPLGYDAEDFVTLAAAPPTDSPAVWLLSFNIEQNVPLFRHLGTGCLIPVVIPNLRVPASRLLKHDPAESGADPALVAHLRAHFAYQGAPPDSMIADHFRTLLNQAGPGVRIFTILGNSSGTDSEGNAWVAEGLHLRNAIIAEVAAGFPAVELLHPRDFMSTAEALAQAKRHHFDRMVYFRIFQHIVARMAG